MKKIIIYLSALLALAFTACEEVIELDLNEANPAIVIEGGLTSNDLSHSILITKTGSYTEPGNFEAVDDANIILSDDQGNEITFSEMGQGVYQIENYELEEGRTYSLDVEYEDTQYSAQSTMFPPVELDSIVYEEVNAPDFAGGGRLEGFAMRAYFQDPPGESNYLNLRLFLNDEPVNEYFLYNDRETDGETVFVPFFQNLAESGDEVRIEVQAIDSDAYDYFNTLAELSGTGFGQNQGSTAPSNPNTNWSSDALGYFAVFNTTVYQEIVP